MKPIYLIVSLFLILGCSNRDTKYNYYCGLAPSTPTDLIIRNDNSEKVEINLLVKETTLKKFGSIEIEPYEEKQICIENEGEISEGLYLEYNKVQTKVILDPLATNKFYVKSRTLRIEKK